jgi:hypothetical protein
MQKIACVNESTVVTDLQVQQCIAALQIQHDRDFAWFWNLGQVHLYFMPKGEKVPTGVWELVFADNSDQVGALGYHEVTEWDDPIGFVFCKSCIDDGTSWTVDASHEFLEMMVDPRINTVAEQDNADGSMIFFMKEVADACEDDSFGYDITLPDGVQILVSDFVTQNWFDQNAQPIDGRKYDFKEHISKPFELLVNGYIGLLDINAGPQWQQKLGPLASKTAEQLAPAPFHRRFRRMMGKQNWKRSARV